MTLDRRRMPHLGTRVPFFKSRHRPLKNADFIRNTAETSAFNRQISGCLMKLLAILRRIVQNE